MAVRLLLIEDDARLCAALTEALDDEGYQITTRPDGDSGLLEATLGRFDVIVLDWMLPGRQGPEVCRAMRGRDVTTPVLMLTARGDTADRVEGLDALADDYLTKPFELDELLARLRALTRRNATLVGEVLRVGPVEVDLATRTVTRDGTLVDLTSREFALLTALAKRPRRLVTRQMLFDEAWDGDTDLRSNALDVHISALRSKLDKPFGVKTIHTVHGSGYRLDPA